MNELNTNHANNIDHQKEPKKKSFKFLLIIFLVAILVMGLVSAGLILKWSEEKIAQPVSIDTMYTVEPGTSLLRVIRDLSDKKMITCSLCLKWHLKIFGAPSIKAGTYALQGEYSSLDIIEKMAKGEIAEFKVTLVEGQVLDDWLTALWNHPQIKKTIPGADRQARYAYISKQLDIKEENPEGLFLPDTYAFSAASEDIEILQRAYSHQQRVLEQLWEKRDDKLPLKTPYEALILASIVEKETGQASERPIIAGVFVNRLNKGMRLETDPTVIYGIENYSGNITRAHLREETAYNTYRIPGLPPTPIAAPSKAAIKASLHPATTDAIFFVARGDGSHTFSATLQQHNAAVREYQLKRRQDYRSAPQ